MTKPKHDLQRIRVNAQGYDGTGAYWGAGPDVFIATSADGTDEITVRAKSVTEARAKIAAELARAPGKKQTNDDPIGGNAPRKTRYEILWLNPLTSETIKIRITHARDYLSSGTDHLDIESMSPKKAPLSITETGYRSHFIPPLDLMNAGGPVTFVKTWIEQEAKGKAWSRAATAKTQGDLFSWAEAQSEVSERKSRARTKQAKTVAKRPAFPAVKSKAKDGKPSRRRMPGADPA